MRTNLRVFREEKEDRCGWSRVNKWAVFGMRKEPDQIGSYRACQEFVCLFFALRATPRAYGSSQTRGRIGATAAGLHHSCICHLHHNSWQCRILNPLSGARDRTCILMDTSWTGYCWATMGTSENLEFYSKSEHFKQKRRLNLKRSMQVLFGNKI